MSATAFELKPFTLADLVESVSPGCGDQHPPIAVYLFRYLSDLGARIIVIESEYIDADYLDDFSSYYSRCFTEYPRKCNRLHFFAQEATKHEVGSAILGPEDLGLSESYLGFVVVRSIPSAPVGRTVLKTYGSDDGRRHYPVTRPYECNLLGLSLSVQSLAYQQQDRAVAACATAALWCAFHKTSKDYSTRLPRPAEITAMANSSKGSGRVFPNNGLEIKQICAAIRGVGLEPELYPVEGGTYLPSLLYAHVAAGIPAILCAEVQGVGLHAFTVVGYSLKDDAVLNSETVLSEPMPLIGRRIDEFYVHDDQIGPFARLKVKGLGSSKLNPVTFEGTWQSGGVPHPIVPFAVVVPIYHKIRLSFVEVQEHLIGLDRFLAAIFGGSEPREWDIRLSTVNEHKSRIRANPRIDVATKRRVLMARHPRFIWKANFRHKGTTILQLLADATELRGASLVYSVTWFDLDSERSAKRFLALLDDEDLLRYMDREFLTLLQSS